MPHDGEDGDRAGTGAVGVKQRLTQAMRYSLNMLAERPRTYADSLALRKLEALGLITRTPVPDGTRVDCTITDAGRQAVAIAHGRPVE